MAEIVKDYLINPFLYVVAFSFAILFFRRLHKWTLILFIVFFYIMTTPLTYHLVLQAWHVPDTKDFSSPYNIAVVSSGVVDHEWYRFERSEYPGVEYVALNGNKERIFAGINLLKSNMVKKLFFGNFFIGTFSETEVVREFVFSQGVNNDRFITFGEVSSSRDEAARIFSYFAGHPPKRLLLITSEVHMRRAVAAFHKQGLYPDTYSVNRISERIKFKTLLPSPGGARATKVLLYEIFAWINYYFRGDI